MSKNYLAVIAQALIRLEPTVDTRSVSKRFCGTTNYSRCLHLLASWLGTLPTDPFHSWSLVSRKCCVAGVGFLVADTWNRGGTIGQSMVMGNSIICDPLQL